MAQKQFLLARGQAVTIAADAADRLIAAADPFAALLYLYILRHGGSINEERAARELHASSQQVARTLLVLVGMGLLADGGGSSGGGQAAPAGAREDDEPPMYDKADIARGLERDGAFKSLYRSTEEMLGKCLSHNDLSILYGIYDRMGFEPGAILMLISFMLQSSSRRPGLRQIQREAAIWERSGITSVPAAEAHIKKRERYLSVQGGIARLLQLGDRKLTVSEEKYVDGWIEMGLSNDMIYKAYDITVVKTGGLRWAYMDTILKSWHDKGFKTVESIERTEGPRPARGTRQADGGQAPAAGGAEQQAAQWLKKKYSRKGDGENG